jgi:hypothetical protein
MKSFALLHQLVAFSIQVSTGDGSIQDRMIDNQDCLKDA